MATTFDGDGCSATVYAGRDRGPDVPRKRVHLRVTPFANHETEVDLRIDQARALRDLLTRVIDDDEEKDSSLVDAVLADELGKLRHELAFGKYTKWIAELSCDQLHGLLWLVGEFAMRDSGRRDVDAVGSPGERRHDAALNAIARFRHDPLVIREVHELMRKAARGAPPIELVQTLAAETGARIAVARAALVEHGNYDKARRSLTAAYPTCDICGGQSDPGAPYCSDRCRAKALGKEAGQ